MLEGRERGGRIHAAAPFSSSDASSQLWLVAYTLITAGETEERSRRGNGSLSLFQKQLSAPHGNIVHGRSGKSMTRGGEEGEERKGNITPFHPLCRRGVAWLVLLSLFFSCLPFHSCFLFSCASLHTGRQEGTL